MKKLLLTLPALLMAEGQQQGTCNTSCITYKVPDAALCGVPAAYNMNARISACGDSTFFFDASYLYWCVAEEFLDVGTFYPYDGAGGTAATPGTLALMPHEYTSGFRVGLGTGSTFDDINFRLEYTFLHRTKTFTIGTPRTSYATGTSVIQTNEWFSYDDDGFTAGYVNAAWEFHFDALDLSMSRPYYFGEKSILTPYTGLLGVHLHQQYNLTAFEAEAPTAAPALSNTEATSWAIGPEIGADLRWVLGYGTRIELGALFGLLYNNYTNQNHTGSVITAGSATAATTSSSVPNQGYLRTYADLTLGLGWGTYYYNRYHFDMIAAYEFINYASQNMMRENVSAVGGFAHPAGDLNLHGLTLTFRFDY